MSSSRGPTISAHVTEPRSVSLSTASKLIQQVTVDWFLEFRNALAASMTGGLHGISTEAAGPWEVITLQPPCPTCTLNCPWQGMRVYYFETKQDLLTRTRVVHNSFLQYLYNSAECAREDADNYGSIKVHQQDNDTWTHRTAKRWSSHGWLWMDFLYSLQH